MLSLKSTSLSMLLFITCIALAHCVLEPSDSFALQDESKNEDIVQVHKRPSFFVGSRYGRSGSSSPLLFGPSKARRLSVVPRNDRFFLGSRYGKRAGEYTSPYEQGSNNNNNNIFGFGGSQQHNGDGNALEAILSNSGDAAGKTVHVADGNNNNKSSDFTFNSLQPFMMSCTYTGMRNLYRCNSVEEINNVISQLTTAHTDDDKRK